MCTKLSCEAGLVGESSSLSIGIALFRIGIDHFLVIDEQLESLG
jgi:hypothetical protein